MLTCISDFLVPARCSLYQAANLYEQLADIGLRDINFVIMDYLVNEGYPRAAEKFAKEANIQLPFEEESIQSRVEIRRAIHAGDIDTAITKINDLNPQVGYFFYRLSTHLLAGLYSVSCTTQNLL